MCSSKRDLLDSRFVLGNLPFFFCFFFCTCTAQKNKLQTDRCDIFSMVTGSASWRGFSGGLEGAGEMKTMKSPM